MAGLKIHVTVLNKYFVQSTLEGSRLNTKPSTWSISCVLPILHIRPSNTKGHGSHSAHRNSLNQLDLVLAAWTGRTIQYKVSRVLQTSKGRVKTTSNQLHGDCANDHHQAIYISHACIAVLTLTVTQIGRHR
jgi:hypothetical protein